MAKQKKEPVASAEGHYEECNVEITRDESGKATAKKLGVSRKCVKITDDEAATLNAGVLTGGNTYAKMYFKVAGKVKAEESETPGTDLE